MTARASPLTGRAIVRAQTLAVFLDGLEALGHDADALAGAAGLTRSQLRLPDARIPCAACEAVIGAAQRSRFTPNLGVELAQRTPLGAWPLVDYLVVTSDTVGAGVRQLARYLRLTGDPISIDVHDGRDRVGVEFHGTGPFACEFELALMARHLRAETEDRFRPVRASLRHRPDDPAAVEGAVGCPLEWAAAWDGLTIARDAWALPLRRRDPALRALLESRADEILARLPRRTGTAADVQRVVAAQIRGGEATIASVSRALAMSPRTLQRRLAEEDTTFQDLLDGARKEAAATYLSLGTLAIGEVAYLLGYSEPSAFHRAFKRWYGMTPEAFRRR